MFKLHEKWKLLGLFKNHSDLDKWPRHILLQIVFLNRAFLREFCCYCGKTLRFKKSQNVVGDSGEICPACLRKECPELYAELKSAGKFTQTQICEAEKLNPGVI